MMNVLRHLQPPQRPLQAGWLAVSMGLLLGLGGSVWQAQEAELNLPKLRIEKTEWQAQLQLAQQAQTSQSDIDGLQFSLTQATQRLQALEQRQSMRLDLQEVQALLFAKKPLRHQNEIQLQKLHWQGGRFEWEGSSLSSTAVQDLLVQVNAFDRWQTAPQMVQVQSDNALPGAIPSLVLKPTHQGMVQGMNPGMNPSMLFKLEGQIERASWPPHSAAQSP